MRAVGLLIPLQSGHQWAHLNPLAHRKLSWGRGAIWVTPTLVQSPTNDVTTYSLPAKVPGGHGRLPRSHHFPQVTPQLTCAVLGLPSTQG